MVRVAKGDRGAEGSSLAQGTAHLLAEESLTMGSAQCSKSAWRASCVTKRLAPSTIVRAEGVPSGSRKSFQLEPLMVEGRPPPVTKTSACTRLCMELRLAAPG